MCTGVNLQLKCYYINKRGNMLEMILQYKWLLVRYGLDQGPTGPSFVFNSQSQIRPRKI